jgi:hypothetical protein
LRKGDCGSATDAGQCAGDQNNLRIHRRSP